MGQTSEFIATSNTGRVCQFDLRRDRIEVLVMPKDKNYYLTRQTKFKPQFNTFGECTTQVFPWYDSIHFSYLLQGDRIYDTKMKENVAVLKELENKVILGFL